MDEKEIKNKIKDFTDLKAWQVNHSLVIEIYRITKSFPKEEIYSLVDQMRRASVSITSNIAEGFGRQGIREKIQFYYLAQGSLIELKNQLIIGKDVGYIDSNKFNILKKSADMGHQLLQGLIRKSKSFITHKS